MRGRAELGPSTVALVGVAEVDRRRRLPWPLRWLLWLLAALVGCVVLGFVAGLARPREPDPWTASTAAGADSPAGTVPTGQDLTDPPHPTSAAPTEKEVG